jgi:multidrug efflux pump subunit AcrA (membrane-fusion protein)
VFTKAYFNEEGNKTLKNKSFSVLSFPKPTEKFIKPYEKLKAKHQVELYTQFDNEMWETKNVAEEAKVQVKNDMSEMAQKVLDTQNRLKDAKGRFVAAKIAAYLGIGTNKACVIRAMAESLAHPSGI